jgi:hypothetical protein
MLKTGTPRPPDETIIPLHDTTEMITAPLDTATNAMIHPATETESVAVTVGIVTESETVVKNDIAKKTHLPPIIEVPTEKAVVEIIPPLVVAAIPRVK